MTPDPETVKAIREQDDLKMKCLLLANEAAAAEVRKLTKTKVKNQKEGNKSTHLVPKLRPSIASEGVFGELPKQDSSKPSDAPVPVSSDKTFSSEHALAVSLSIDSPAGAATKDPEASKISVQETSQVVPALLALWVSNAGQSAEKKDQTKTGNGSKDKWEYDEDGEANEAEEIVDLFPKRESRPY